VTTLSSLKQQEMEASCHYVDEVELPKARPGSVDAEYIAVSRRYQGGARDTGKQERLLYRG
jgi:hypothetical protein